MKMIDQKSSSLPKERDSAPQAMVNLKMTMSSSFTHLSMDTDEFSVNGDERPTPATTATQSTATYSFALYDALIDICQNNIKYFECDDSETGQRFLCAFRGIIDHIAIARQFVTKITTFVHEYDFDEVTPANGYRSFVKTISACINHNFKVAKYIAQNRSYLLFRKNMYMKEIEACSHLLASLCSCLEQIMIIRTNSEFGSLFPLGDHKAIGLFNTSACVNQYSFYGRCIGFHYCESMQSVMKFLGICLAGFSEIFYNNNGNRIMKATSSMYTGGKYYWNPELRARRIVNLSQYAGIDFCKAFWSLTEGELMYALPNVFGVKVKVNRLITIPPEPLELQSVANPKVMVEIPVPSSHLGVGSVTARLLSSVRRDGMIGERNKKHMHPPSKSLIFHCHGGGFVAQSSKSHEVYLREWAARLHAPILSIDYSLAPQAPYPRALEEVFYAYCWAIKNAKVLGTTAEKIVVVGDSAGANLNMALTLKCIDKKIRKPDGVFLIYCPMKMGFDPSPARFLCLMDVLLPFGFLMGCLKAYVHPGKDQFLTDKRQADKSNEKDDKKDMLNDTSVSTTSAVIVLMSDAEESDMPTFVHLGSESQDNEHANDKQTDTSISIDGGSMWEHIEHDPNYEENNKSPMSDGTSDTFASASLQNSQTDGNSNTEMMTPDESNGISFEEDSQPLTQHKPTAGLQNGAFEICNIDENVNVACERRRNSTSSSLLEMDSTEPPNNEPKNFVDDFVEKYGKEDLTKATASRTQSEDNVLFEEGREALNMQNIPTKIYKAVETAANSVASTFNAITSPTIIRNGITNANGLGFTRSRLNSLVERNPADDYLFEVPHDPFLSPWDASDEMLLQLPSVKILTVDMDPCLDDCIMMAKRLKALGIPIGLDVLPGLPHGFLSFVKLSKEAYEGNRVCILRLAELLETTVDPKC
ncbi:hormone-sensitive lipase [Contarinia nasturtii]|uniref:hormone-sensitive lipase n=1 Tax=Contarinia nasturtii TaxID=265458 RepID=UPI0012D3E7FD|nr:hormone-sensitive lipase [Contarinia nasturtii]XP_031621457.1 hormone-sensitive lipase [Contarinia nasturtii]XP_031621458.1 hormone-sensitive lipase [Contarinia nasturtii]XP_031621459.1 hormone-sensitive lipase [Contarinia nasturtii]XP_031621460.1 hormone-sensitive lipase [Contarinia nasturtii]